MEEKKTFTDVEVLRDAIGTLEQIMLPVSMIESVGMSLSRVSGNLRALLDAIERQQAQKPQEEEEPTLEFVEAVPKAEVEVI